MSWLLPSFLTGASAASPAPPPSSTSSSSSTPASTSPRARRMPPPPGSRALQRSASPEDSRKRDRGWLPRSSSFTNDEGGVSDVLEPTVSGTRAEGSFDTPRNYFEAARAGAIPVVEEQEQQEVDGEGEEGDERPPKRRKGLVGTTLSVALDAALFASAVGLTAVQLWRHPPNTHQDVERLLRIKAAEATATPPDAPPPYSETLNEARGSQTSSTSSQSPSKIPRRVRHAHPPRPRPSNGRRSFPPPPSDLSNPPRVSVPGPVPHSFNFRVPLPHELPQFIPMEHSDEEGGDAQGYSSSDEEMKAVAEQIKSLIDGGRQALVSEPNWNTVSSQDSTHNPTPKPLQAHQHHSRPSTSSTIPHPSTPTLSSRFASGTPSSASRHGRRASTNDTALGSPFPSLSSRPIPISSSRTANHTPRSSRGGSLAGLPSELARREREREETGLRAFEGALQRASSQQSGKGWWEQ